MNLTAIIRGVAISFLLSIASITFILFWILSSEHQYFYLPDYLMLTSYVSLLIGGAVAGKMVQQKWWQHGLMLSLGYLFIAYFLSWALLPLSYSPEAIINILLACSFGIIGAGAGQVLRRTIAFTWRAQSPARTKQKKNV